MRKRRASEGEESEGDEGEGGGGRGDEASISGTESIDEVLDADGDDDAHEASPAAPAEPKQSYSGNTAERQHTGFYISPVLEAQLAAFDVHRSAPINQHRKGASVTKTTRQSDRGRICRYLKWLAVTYALKTSPTLNVFLHASIAAAAQRYIKEMIEQHQRKYSYASVIAASLVAVASFAATRRQVGRPVNGVLAQLQALHLQCRKLARRDDKFEVAEKPASWLDWDAVQRVRCAAEEALAASESEKERLKLTRDVTILRFLADQPPDRVGVTRALQLGGTLKRVDGGYQLDLSEGSHKTAAVFGATRTSISPTVSPWLDDYISLADIPEGGFLFHPRDDKLHALSPSMWTKLVKGLFARHGDVALCPKDARSSFITFLRSGDHDDEVTRAAAVAMRHSSKMQASSAYDKGSCDRRVSAAMKVAADYSAKFKATGPV